jgi:membrane-bound lytic murein transglycosylase D
LLRFNKVRSARSLRIGQNLLVPRNAGGMSLADVREAMRDEEPAPRGQGSGFKQYKVRSGDSLWKIAQRFHVSERQLRAWNGMGSRTALKPGQSLVIAAAGSGEGKAAPVKSVRPAAPKVAKADLKKVVYKVRAGDSLWTIGRQFDVDAQQIRDWNKLPRNPVLRPGQRLTLLVRSASRG